MALYGYEPITLIKTIGNMLRGELNAINPNRLFTVRSVDTNWEEFVEKTGWANKGGIVWIKVREGGEKFEMCSNQQVRATTTYLIRCAVPCMAQRGRGGTMEDEDFLDDFVNSVYSKVVEVGVSNQEWTDERGNQLTYDCRVEHGGMFTSKQYSTPLFIFDTYFVTSNIFTYTAESVAS